MFSCRGIYDNLSIEKKNNRFIVSLKKYSSGREIKYYSNNISLIYKNNTWDAENTSFNIIIVSLMILCSSLFYALIGHPSQMCDNQVNVFVQYAMRNLLIFGIGCCITCVISLPIVRLLNDKIHKRVIIHLDNDEKITFYCEKNISEEILDYIE